MQSIHHVYGPVDKSDVVYVLRGNSRPWNHIQSQSPGRGSYAQKNGRDLWSDTAYEFQVI